MRNQPSESGFSPSLIVYEETVLVAQIEIKWFLLVVAKLVYPVDLERLAALRAFRRRGYLVGWAVCGHGVPRGRSVLQPTETDH